MPRTLQKRLDVLRKFIIAERRMRQYVFARDLAKRDRKVAEADRALAELDAIEAQLRGALQQESLF